MSDAFLTERDAHFVRDVDLRSVMHAFGACGNASHHLSQRSDITYHLFCKKIIFLYNLKKCIFLSDAFLTERDAHFVRDAASPVMHAFGACAERIASPITAQQHHLSLVCKEFFI